MLLLVLVLVEVLLEVASELVHVEGAETWQFTTVSFLGWDHLAKSEVERRSSLIVIVYLGLLIWH